MARIAATIEGLGTPRSSGAPGVLRTSSGRLIDVTWDADDENWTSLPQLSMRQKITLGMASNGAHTAEKYPTLAEFPRPINDRGWGFQIHKIQNPAEIYDTGLQLQEYLSGEMFARDLTGSVDPEDLPFIALNWYELDEGGQFLTPDPDNFGVPLFGDRTATVYRAFTTGWQTSPVPQPVTDGIWYPEIYTMGPVVNFRHFCAWHRFVGGTVPAADPTPPATQYPPHDHVVVWSQAADILQSDGQAVTEWANYSGRGWTWQQTASAKRPIVRTDPSGSPRPRHVRFDGSNDCLRMPDAIMTQPATVFLVIRQQAPGGAQQVWLGQHASGASLLYRNDAVDEVNVWAGGTDLSYNRASPWPSPWMVWSVVLDGADTSIWENLTEVDAGDAGSNGFSGLVLGNNHGETLPARIDIAEVLVIADAIGDTPRAALVAQIQARHGLV